MSGKDLISRLRIAHVMDFNTKAMQYYKISVSSVDFEKLIIMYAIQDSKSQNTCILLFQWPFKLSNVTISKTTHLSIY